MTELTVANDDKDSPMSVDLVSKSVVEIADFNWEHEKEREQIETLAFPKVKVKLIGMNHPNSSFNLITHNHKKMVAAKIMSLSYFSS